MAKRKIHMSITDLADTNPKVACGEYVTKYEFELGSSYAGGKLRTTNWNHCTCKQCLKARKA